MIKDFGEIRTSIRQKYLLDSNNIAVGAEVYFIFIADEKYLEKGIKKGRILRADERTYTISSDSMYVVPRYLTFLNKLKAEAVLGKISVDELRFLY